MSFTSRLLVVKAVCFVPYYVQLLLKMEPTLCFLWVISGMSMEDIRKYESTMQTETNKLVGDAEASAKSVDGTVEGGPIPLTPVNTPIDKNAAFFSANDAGSN
jgi:hypothetical protein